MHCSSPFIKINHSKKDHCLPLNQRNLSPNQGHMYIIKRYK